MLNKYYGYAKLLSILMILGCVVLFGCDKTNSLASAAGQNGSIRQNEINLGGIGLGMSYDDVIACYGQPSRIEPGYAQLVRKVIFYGDNVEIGFLNDKVRYVTVTANNGWKTPSGIHVGLPMKDVISVYGTGQTVSSPTKRSEKNKKSPFYELRWQGIRYMYRCIPANVHMYKPGDISWVLAITNSDQAKKANAITIMEITPEF